MALLPAAFSARLLRDQTHQKSAASTAGAVSSQHCHWFPCYSWYSWPQCLLCTCRAQLKPWVFLSSWFPPPPSLVSLWSRLSCPDPSHQSSSSSLQSPSPQRREPGTREPPQEQGVCVLCTHWFISQQMHKGRIQDLQLLACLPGPIDTFLVSPAELLSVSNSTNPPGISSCH